MPVQEEGIKWDLLKVNRLEVKGYRCGHESVVTDCPPETGATSEAEGVDCFPFPFAVAKIRHKIGALQDRER